MSSIEVQADTSPTDYSNLPKAPFQKFNDPGVVSGKDKPGWKTYNFEVAVHHTYVAGGIRVHNDSGFLGRLGNTINYGVDQALDVKPNGFLDHLTDFVTGPLHAAGHLISTIGELGNFLLDFAVGVGDAIHGLVSSVFEHGKNFVTQITDGTLLTDIRDAFQSHKLELEAYNGDPLGYMFQTDVNGEVILDALGQPVSFSEQHLDFVSDTLGGLNGPVAV